MSPHEFLEHTGEARLRITGATEAECFAQAARALGELQRGNIAGVDGDLTHQVRLSGKDLPGLLVDWLNELIFLSETTSWVPRDTPIFAVTPTSLHASVTGPRQVQRPALVKAATAHGVRIYAAMVEQKSGEHVKGALINAVCCNEKGADPPEAWTRRKSAPSAIRVISFTRAQLDDAHEWIRGNLVVRDAAAAGTWPRNEMACDDYGGCVLSASTTCGWCAHGRCRCGSVTWRCCETRRSSSSWPD